MALTNEDDRSLAAQLFNDTWTLLEQENRSPEDDDRLIHSAHASRLHWDNVGDDQNRAIGEWQIARVYCVLGRAEPALFHARRCLDYASRSGVDDWVLASGYEGMARALAVVGDMDAACDARDKAVALTDAITDADERDVVAADIATLPLT